MKMEISTVHVVRHGQTNWNAAGKIQGQTDSDLSALGLQQAARVPDGLRGRSLAAIYSSDLARTVKTAAPLASATGLEPILQAELRERHYGVLETLTWPEVESKYPEIYARLNAGDAGLPLPEGESRQDLLDRVGPAFDRIADAHPGEEVAVVTHGGVLAAFLTLVLGLPPDQRPAVRTLNGGISTFERWGDRWKLITWGSVAHLEGLVSARPKPGTASTA